MDSPLGERFQSEEDVTKDNGSVVNRKRWEPGDRNNKGNGSCGGESRRE